MPIHRCFELQRVTGNIITATGESKGVLRFKAKTYFLGASIDVYLAEINCAVVSATTTCRNNKFQWTFGPDIYGRVKNFKNGVQYPLRLGDDNLWPVPMSWFSKENVLPNIPVPQTKSATTPKTQKYNSFEVYTKKLTASPSPASEHTATSNAASKPKWGKEIMKMLDSPGPFGKGILSEDKTPASSTILQADYPLGRKQPKPAKSALWHGRTGHPGAEKLQFCSRCKIYRDRGLDIEPGEIDLDFKCESCMEACAHKVQSHKALDKDEYKTGQCWHVDATGRKETPALITGTLIGILFRDRKSRFYVGYSVQNNDSNSICHVIDQWDAEELAFWRLLYKDDPEFRFHLYSDNLEFAYPEVEQKLTLLRVSVHHTAPRKSSSNGLAERGIGVISDKERTIRLARNMPECFHEDAWNFAIHYANILPYRYEGKWHIDAHTQYKGQTVNYSKLRIPFSVCYVYNHQRIKGRDVRKGRKGIFCGYVPRSDAYKVWIISESKYDFTGDVTWNEKELQPLIQQANILETGEGIVNSSLPQSTQKTEETSTPLCSSDREQATSTNNEEGGAKIDHSGDANDQTQDDWDAWLDAALINLGNFLVSETTKN